ncbi:MAG: heme lyase CcmF/NrfE family subunit [Phycisphaerae bacterium]|nr:heme lyase CcmF/NrfE family subunit [Phycisphaerae bacterium]
MIEPLGNLSLSGAVLAAAGATLVSVIAGRHATPQGAHLWMRTARWLFVLIGLFLSAAVGLLLTALLTDQFRFEYVASYSERSMLGGYKFAALWAGQAGSLLLWGWLLAILSMTAVFGWRRLEGREYAIGHAVLALVCGFFAAVLLFAANPFQLVTGLEPFDGRGLNPQLQDLSMIIHPPLLFLGYAGFTMPFAILLGVLIVRPQENRWLASIRRWVLFSWVFLGAGILMGAWWAYIELGWGGYWAWDPVENASLLPWLTSTALLHSMFVQQHRGMFKIWNASLIASTFLLCIFGTYITRSGVIDSVHAFAESLIGVFFLVFLLTATLLAVGLMIWRRRELAPPKPIEGLISREGAILGANVLLTVMTMVTLIGTIFPLIGPLVGADGVTVKAPFYNRVVAPMGIGLVGLMALAPVLAFGQQAAQRIAHNLRWPAVGVLIVTSLVAFFLTFNIWALLCVAIVALGTGAVVVDFIRSVGARQRSTGEGLLPAMARLIDRDHRRYGGQIAHLGLMLIVVGVAGSSLFSTESTHTLKPGDTFEEAGFTMRFNTLNETRGENFSAVQASIDLVDAAGVSETITPQVRFYDKWSEQPNAEIALRSTLTEDLYISLAGWESGGHAGGIVAAIQVRVNPVVIWIWFGGIVMVVGGCFCMLPKLLPQARAETRVGASVGREQRPPEAHGGSPTDPQSLPATPRSSVEVPV